MGVNEPVRVKTALEVAAELMGPLTGDQVRRIRAAGDEAVTRMRRAWGPPSLPATDKALADARHDGEIDMVADMLYDRDLKEKTAEMAGTTVDSVAGGAPVPDPGLRPKAPVKEPHGTTRLTLTINGNHYAVKKVESTDPDVSRIYELKKPGPEGAVYHVSVHPYGVECSCPDFIYRREGSASECKHIKSAKVFGLVDGPTAVARPKAPAPVAGMTPRERLEAGIDRHPFEVAGLGPGPFQLFTTLRYTDTDLTRKSAALLHVSAERCGACRSASDTLYVVEGRERQRAAVCPACVRASGDGGLIRRMTHETHERRRLLDSINPANRRLR